MCETLRKQNVTNSTHTVCALLFKLDQISEAALIKLKTQQENNGTVLLYQYSSQVPTPISEYFYLHISKHYFCTLIM